MIQRDMVVAMASDCVRRKVKVRFVDFWPGFDPSSWSLSRILSKKYELVECSDPDYLFDGGMGFHHLKYDCIKILKSGENIVPDFNSFDYAMGFPFLSFGDRYLRLPSYAFYEEAKSLCGGSRLDDAALLDRGFCSFVVSNPVGDPIREKFFKRLSEYKKVDSGGKWMNNVGGPVKDKAAFLRAHKFNIAFENSSSPGYTTEKLVQALAADTVPVYWGDPHVVADFREECMVRLESDADIDRAVEVIARLDSDDAAYLAKCRERRFRHDDPAYFERRVEAFLDNIFGQPLDRARRLNMFGYQATQRRNTKPAMMLHQYARDSFWFVFDLLHGRIRRMRT